MPAINPPNTPLIDERANVRPEWYRYLVQAKAQSDGFASATVITVSDSTADFPYSRVLTVASGELTAEDGSGAITLGLADTTVTPDTYGSASEVLSIIVDAKGRLTGAVAYQLNSDNVTEGGIHLYFTDARAREAISAGAGIDYDNTTGVIAFDPLGADLSSLPVYADNTAATAGGLAVGHMYRTATGQLMVRY